MRNMGRTFGVSLSYLFDAIHYDQLQLAYIATEWMRGDIFTKSGLSGGMRYPLIASHITMPG